MTISPKLKWQISRIIPFGVIWLVSSWVFLLSEFAVAGFQGITTNGAIAISPKIFLFASISVLLVGLIVGVLEVIILNRLFIKYSLGKKIAFKFAFYLLFILIMILVFYPLAGSIEQNTSPFDAKIWQKFGEYLTGIAFLSTMAQVAFSLVLSLIYAAISDNLGHNVLLNFFTGKYHKPQKEERIFMFVDMKSSTSLAEQLGHERYFELLSSYYQTMSDAIVRNEGEVYQYIGDEVVITWPLDKGVKKANCLRCFFDIKKAMGDSRDKFEARFDVFPDFKAGLHFGQVTTGEIGALKKEVIFTGDVLNTTARIQSLCNQYQQDLIISSELMNTLKAEPAFTFESLATVTLKGKAITTDLYSVRLS